MAHEKSLNISDREKTEEETKAGTDYVQPRRFSLPRVCPKCLEDRAKCKCPEQCCKTEKTK